MKRITTVLATFTFVLAVSVPAVLASGGAGTRIGLEGSKAFPGAAGSATFKAKAGERELQAEVEHIRRLAGKRVTIYAAGKRLGTANVNALGAAHISRNSERGQYVPAVASGAKVKVKTIAGVLIVSGSF